ncbi:FkbM family methyltransferase [Roseococcus sp. YIM B11640]|uniref:FkbM family methyltransferase n=1 Tax=Roseococcus sp. YIM B11640 TaxID=3133973 RepID=UPI003C7A5ADD
MIDRNLIFDIGLHTGLDTKFYADKGFKVVSLEANPAMVAEARKILLPALMGGQVTIVEKALWEEGGQNVTFYTVAEKDDWSSLFRGVAEKGQYKATEITVPTLTLKDLFDEHGVPYYLKCDIEGGDAIMVRQLLADHRRPAFVSVEATSLTDIAVLAACGYDRFQIVNQQYHWNTQPPNPPREGKHVPVQFTGHMSGLFGRELPADRWFPFPEVADRFLAWHRLKKMDELLAPGWLDFHATTAATLKAKPA